MPSAQTRASAKRCGLRYLAKSAGQVTAEAQLPRIAYVGLTDEQTHLEADLRKY